MNAAHPYRTRFPTTVLPYALIGAVALADVFAGATVLLSLLAAPPALAAATHPPRGVLRVGAAAFTACLAVAVIDELPLRRGAVALAAVAAVTAAAVYAAAERGRAEARRLRTERELGDIQAVADVAQQFILGPVPARSGSLDLAASCTSAAAGARIGGDFYEALPMPGGMRLIVGDVQGKGLDAVTSAVTVLRAFREVAPGALGPYRVAEHIERALGLRTMGDEFVTAVIAECTHDGEVTLLNFGHPPPLIRRADGSTQLAEPGTPGLPLGLPLGLPSLNSDGPGTCTVQLRPGDRMLLYTDGTVEARDADGDFFPLQDHAPLLDHDDLPHALTDLRSALTAHTESPLDDDAAMLLLRLAPESVGS